MVLHLDWLLYLYIPSSGTDDDAGGVEDASSLNKKKNDKNTFIPENSAHDTTLILLAMGVVYLHMYVMYGYNVVILLPLYNIYLKFMIKIFYVDYLGNSPDF